MDFKAIAERFATSPPGTDAFKAFYQDVFEHMKHDPENAALYFVVAVAAQAYVLKYEDQAVPTELSDFAKRTLVEFNGKLVEALRSDPRKRLRLAGEVAVDYQWNVTAF